MHGEIREPVRASLPSIFVAAHELKAPLVLMRQLALELKSSDPENITTIERLQLTVERSLRLVDQLTKTSRLTDTLFETEPLRAEVLCKVVSDELSPYAVASKQQIETRISRRSGLVIGHRSLLTALLVNLCDNALQHTPEKGKIVLAANAVDQGVRFSVRDFGPSLSHKQFFSLKQQVGNGPLPLNERPRSSGLGLWIASQFAEAMNGELTMIRHRDAGITVSVLLPHSTQLTLL